MPEPTQDDMMMHDTPMPEEMAEPTQNDMIENGMMMDETPMPDEGAMMEAPAWFDTSLKDVRSGEAFTINDFKGKVVLVETMAVWCTTCFQEQGQIQSLHEALGMRDDFISVSLDTILMKMNPLLPRIHKRMVNSIGVMPLPEPMWRAILETFTVNSF